MNGSRGIRFDSVILSALPRVPDSLELPSTDHDFLITVSTRSTQDARAPDTGNSPHTDAPAAVETTDALALPLALQDGLPEKLPSALALGWRATDALFVDDTPDGRDDAAVGLGGGHDGFNGFWGLLICGWGETGGMLRGNTRDLLTETGRSVAGDLGPTQHGFEREADGKF